MSIASLFCLQGRDNSQRVLAIQLCSLFFVLIVALLFSHSATTLIAGLLALPISALSSLRRLRDAAKPNTLVVIPSLLLLFFTLSVGFEFPTPISVIIFVLAAAVSGGFAWFSAPSANKRKSNNTYMMGYQGPHAKPATGAREARRRHEPTIGDGAQTTSHLNSNLEPNADSESFNTESEHFDDELGHEPGYQQETVYKDGDSNQFTAADNSADSFDANDANNYSPESNESSTEYQADEKRTYRVDQGALESGSMTELLKSWLIWAQNNQKMLIIAAKAVGVIFVVGIVIYLVSLLFNSTEDTEPVAVETAPIEQPLTSNETARVKLPDGFWLILQQDILVVRWMGDEGDAQPIWRLDTAKGDKSCAELIFNDGSKIRPVTVDLMADSGTEAKFSPLDNKKLINNVAMRGSFKLCGYNFSLKGSQATLSSEPAFERFIKSL
ncbi:hypothetical protein [Shewanella donghaensis]|uniref:hypothetical protein n=1 Tax=Shewanella donghaensis TaxID=238836 RepID=UPI0011832A3A|nr:hypothetical protein [Shewanella donghaensis]